jgi:hypothetical protein
MFLINPQLENDHWQHTKKKVHKLDKIQLLGTMPHRILPENSQFFKAKALKTTNWKLEATISTSWNRAYKMYNMNLEAQDG